MNVLRIVVIAASALLSCAGIALIAAGVRVPGWQAFGIGVVVLAGTLFERWRYRRISQSPESEWQRTTERFIDPSTGDPVEVQFNPRTGERRYVPLGVTPAE